jgi:hypothetical protein
MTITLYIEILAAVLILIVCTRTILINRNTQKLLRNIINQYNNNQPMATFTDLQTAAADNTAAAQALETAVTNYVTAHSTDITSAQADTIVAAIQASTTSLNAATAQLTV